MYNLWGILQNILIELQEDIPSSFDSFNSSEPELSSQLIQYINEIARKILQDRTWVFRERHSSWDTVASINGYALPNGPIKPSSIVHEGTINKLSYVDYQEEIRHATTESKPYEYTYAIDSSDNTLKVFFKPIPDDVYTIQYTYYTNAVGKNASGTDINTLSAETDVPLIPSSAGMELFTYGVMMKYYKKPPRERYIHWSNEYRKALGSLVNRIQPEAGLHNIHYTTTVRADFRHL